MSTIDYRDRPRTMRLRLFKDTERMIDELVAQRGITATQLMNELILNAYHGKGKRADENLR